MKRALWLLVVAAVLIGAGAWWYFRPRGDQRIAYRTAKIERGDLAQTVRATGTVQPVKLVQVGTQVNGPISKLYVDYNDTVKAGDLVAQIDPTVYEARLAQDEANLLQNRATVEATEAKLVQAEKELVRSRELTKRDMLSQADLDIAVANRDTLAGQLKVTQAAVDQGLASLRLSKANLEYTRIRSPVDGVVIARNVSEGQTVVASMTAQVIFQIATDLRQVQVEAGIPEADIGKIRAEQPVTFTVDAYDEEFRGIVSQVRLAAVTVQNVVTYPVVIRADNPDGKLFPGMTANIACEVARQTGVLKVANAALRFKPADAPPGGHAPAGNASAGGQGPKLWIRAQRGGPPAPVTVTLGITDGTSTALKDPGSLQAGQEVIVGIADTGAPAQDTVNPFAPPRFPSGGTRRH